MADTCADSFLVRLAQGIKEAINKSELLTADFVKICDHLIPVFDDLGTVFSFAKKEFSTKNASLAESVTEFVTLRELVDFDKKKGTVSVKNSRARNLHRLGSALMFITLLMEELVKSNAVALKDAAYVAYQEALAPIHTKIVKGIVIAGLLTLPSRETFLQSVKETEESAKERVKILIPLAEEMVKKIHALYDEPMPVSNTWFVST